MPINDPSNLIAMQKSEPSNVPTMPINDPSNLIAMQKSGHSNVPAMPTNAHSKTSAMPKSLHSDFGAMQINDLSNFDAMQINEHSNYEINPDNQHNNFAMPKNEHSNPAPPPPPSSSSTLNRSNNVFFLLMMLVMMLGLMLYHALGPSPCLPTIPFHSRRTLIGRLSRVHFLTVAATAMWTCATTTMPSAIGATASQVCHHCAPTGCGLPACLCETMPNKISWP
jgi:hypothetical protein